MLGVDLSSSSEWAKLQLSPYSHPPELKSCELFFCWKNTFFGEIWTHFCLGKVRLHSQFFWGVGKVASVPFWAMLSFLEGNYYALFDVRTNFCLFKIQGLLVGIDLALVKGLWGTLLHPWRHLVFLNVELPWLLGAWLVLLLHYVI